MEKIRFMVDNTALVVGVDVLVVSQAIVGFHCSGDNHGDVRGWFIGEIIPAFVVGVDFESAIRRLSE